MDMMINLSLLSSKGGEMLYIIFNKYKHISMCFQRICTFIICNIKHYETMMYDNCNVVKDVTRPPAIAWS